MRKNLILLPLLFVIIFSSCSYYDNKTVTVDFKEQKSGNPPSKPDSEPVYVAIASMTSPKVTYKYYSDLVHYISRKINRPILVKQKKTYEEVNELLKDGSVDFAFICSGAYIEIKKKNLVYLLVAPVIDGKTTYNAFIITQKNNNIHSFLGLKGKSFAYTDPLSNTGKLYPSWLLKKWGFANKRFFSKTVYTYAHDESIQMVNRGIVDGASVHSLIYNYIAAFEPEEEKNIKIIDTSQNFGMPPVVTPVSLSKEKYDMYQSVFLNIDKDSIGRAILKKLKIDKFVNVSDTIYNSVRKLKGL